MLRENKLLIDRLAREQCLALSEYGQLVTSYSAELAEYAAELADKRRREIYDTDVYIRGLIEIGNYCRNDCLYCGIRRSNANCERYRITEEQILSCCRDGYELGFRTFVLQGGEGVYSVDETVGTVKKIRQAFPDCAITLSLGEYSYDDYLRMYNAGANRYLLRHETADREHYEKLHPSSMSFNNRMRCLYNLKKIGFQVGCGFMVGSPYQTAAAVAKDLKFIEEFSPDMCGIGPFIPQKDTPFGKFPAGSAEITVYLLSLIRLIKPSILLPATTALGTIIENGREMGIKAGANVVMPNLSPTCVRKKYALYDNKISTGAESAQHIKELDTRIKSAGFKLNLCRGDIKKERLEEHV